MTKILKANITLERSSGFKLNVDLSLPNTGLTAIFGHSGSGKTTLLRCLAGLETPTSADISINNVFWASKGHVLPVHKRPLGFVFQHANLLPHLTVRRNLEFATKRAVCEITTFSIDHIIELFSLEPLLDVKPSMLSGGEQQRVAMARALLIQPQILFMDEPLASLDMNAKNSLIPVIQTIKDTLSVPILYVSHSVDEIVRLADRILIMDSGKIVNHGNPNHVLSDLDIPMSFGEDLGVVLTGVSTDYCEKYGLTEVIIEHQALSILGKAKGQKPNVGVRVLAQDVSITLSEDHLSSIQNKLKANVVSVADDTQFGLKIIKLAVGEQYILARITAKSAASLKLEIGLPVFVQIKSAVLMA